MWRLVGDSVTQCLVKRYKASSADIMSVKNKIQCIVDNNSIDYIDQLHLIKTRVKRSTKQLLLLI